MKSACSDYQLLLSAYADGEVNAREREQVELHLSGCGECRTRLADLRALGPAVGAHALAEAEKADFGRFADEVLRRIGPERPPLLERLRVGFSELVAYHRVALISSAVTAAVTLAVAVPLVYRLATLNATSPEVIVERLELDDPSVQPVVMNVGEGKTLIMLVDRPGADAGEPATPDIDKEPPSGGEL